MSWKDTVYQLLRIVITQGHGGRLGPVVAGTAWQVDHWTSSLDCVNVALIAFYVRVQHLSGPTPTPRAASTA